MSPEVVHLLSPFYFSIAKPIVASLASSSVSATMSIYSAGSATAWLELGTDGQQDRYTLIVHHGGEPDHTHHLRFKRDAQANTDVVWNWSTGIWQFVQGLRTLTATDNVSDPPTDAELDTAFGTPATVGEGFVGLVDDGNAEATIWLCAAIGSTWWYEELTKAV